MQVRGPKFDGGWEGSRTPDTGIFSPLLYQLSYPADVLACELVYNTKPRAAVNNFLREI